MLAQLFIKRELYPFASKNALRWGHRQKQLLSEIIASQADIIALQEVDNCKTFWQPKLFAAGYEVVHLSKDDHPSRAGSQKGKGIGITPTSGFPVAMNKFTAIYLKG